MKINIAIILGSLLGFITAVLQETFERVREKNRYVKAAYVNRETGKSYVVYGKKDKEN